ncbi:MAG: tetratricopeptide repeat protein [Kiritimatiellae bacterium]|nr:tetratricopeptide repeat protein [Kiritimatiellia bacterium]MDW8459221.1 tetratricopeptide repeat protein [Verrucomicrobiota bacterium]
MRRAGLLQLGVVMCLAAAAAGCATPRAPSQRPEPDEPVLAPDKSLPPERAAFADALAHYAVGISAEWGDGSAISNFLRAAELDPENEELQFRVALMLVRDQRGEEACEIVKRLADRRSASARAQVFAAVIHRITGRQDEALRYYRRAIRVDPGDPVPYLEIAAMLARAGRFQDALDLLQSGLERAREKQDLVRMTGQILVRRASALQDPQAAARSAREGLSIFEPLVSRGPRDEATLLHLAMLYNISGQLGKALETIEQVERLKSPDAQWRLSLLTAMVRQIEAPAAVLAMARLADEQPTNVFRQIMLGHLHEMATDPTAAEAAYRRALELEPGDVTAILRLSLLLLSQQRNQDAQTLLEDAIRRRPENNRLIEMLAYTRLGQNQLEEALSLFEQLRDRFREGEQSPLVPYFNVTHALVALHAGRIDLAVRLIDDELKNNSDFLELITRAIMRETDPKRRQTGLDALRQLAEVEPDNPYVFLYQGLLAGHMKRYEEAAAAFERAESLARESDLADDILTASFYFWYGAARERLGQIDEAAALFKKCIEMAPTPERLQDYNAWVDALNYLAYMWAERGLNLDEALRLVNRALEISPDNAAYIDTRGWIYFMQGRYEEAREEIERAISLMPDDPTLTDHLGDIYEKLGILEEAVDWWTKSFRLDPENEKVAEKLRRNGVNVDAIRAELEAARSREQPSESPPAIPPVLPVLQGDDEEPTGETE